MLSQKRAVIFLNGTMTSFLPPKALKFTPYDLLLCVDGGVRHARDLAIRPHIILGDFDSLPADAQEIYKNAPVEWIRHPAEKNQYETDSELALRVAKERGITDCLIYGFSGSRIDHMIANLFLFARYAKFMRITVMESHQRLTFVTREYAWEGNPEDLVSLIPLSASVRGLTTANLKYDLSDFTLKQGSTLGVSNVMTASHASIRLLAGVLLVAHYWTSDA